MRDHTKGWRCIPAPAAWGQRNIPETLRPHPQEKIGGKYVRDMIFFLVFLHQNLSWTSPTVKSTRVSLRNTQIFWPFHSQFLREGFKVQVWRGCNHTSVCHIQGKNIPQTCCPNLLHDPVPDIPLPSWAILPKNTQLDRKQIERADKIREPKEILLS